MIVYGEYSNLNYKKLECVVTLPQIEKVKQIAKDIDEHAFIYIANVSEALGKGFYKEQDKI